MVLEGWLFFIAKEGKGLIDVSNAVRELKGASRRNESKAAPLMGLDHPIGQQTCQRLHWSLTWILVRYWHKVLLPGSLPHKASSTPHGAEA